jgi:2'-hydroxyisoflavone reductase
VEMKILIIGGTMFVGRHIVLAAKERGHEITLFHRGKHNPGLFPDVETIHGDRLLEEDWGPLDGRTFDAVIDTCAYFPRAVHIAANALKDKTDFYCFISTVSVYADLMAGNVTEDSPLATTIADPTTEEVKGETYGPLKVICEAAVTEAFPEKALILRPGLIVGPYDHTDRFAYWPHRIAKGGEVLAPDSPDWRTQFIDARDLAEFTVHLLNRKTTGIYNVVGPDYPLTFGELLETCQTVSGSDATITYVPGDFLQAQGVQPWSELPLWIPSATGEPEQDRVHVNRALAKGLMIRPLSETVHDTLLWDRGRSQEGGWKNTLTAEKEAAVLEQWRIRA